MRKLYTPLIFLFFVALYLPVAAQHCDNYTPCTPLSTLPSPGFEHPDTTPCIIQGQDYNHAIQILMYAQFTTAGQTADVDSVEFTGINNLPCGLCWSTNKSTNRFKKNEYGCIQITGNSTDSVGLYKLSISLKAYIKELAPASLPVPPATVDDAGIKMYLRVQAPTDACPAVDTSKSAALITANPSMCATGIRDLAGSISSLNILPNPLNTSSMVSFTAAQKGTYTLTVSDLTGKTISTRQMDVTTGENKAVLNRQDLSVGLYLLTLSNGTSQATRRFAVVD